MSTLSSSVKFNKAVTYEKMGDFENALNEYIGIINTDPTYRNAYLNLGSLYSRMNKLNKALKYYNSALELGADFITFFNIGCIYYKIGKYSNAISYLENAYRLNNNFILSKLIIGLSHSRLNNLGDAEISFTDVLKLWPDNRVALTALSIIYYNCSNFYHALRLLNKLLLLDSNNIKIRELKSDILLKIGAIDESAKEIKIIKSKAAGYKLFDEYIQSVPVEMYNDKYGTLDEKIITLQNKNSADSSNLISLSLCHLLKGDSDTAIDYLYKFKKKKLN